ncbi:MAG: hypothetical protein LUD72_09080 [Bacteroidales bacterium]|nr:hypothetical protein [Bacteroidales bacterium]
MMMTEVLTINNMDIRLDRKLDGKGRLILPGDLREALHMEPDADVEIRVCTLQRMNGMAVTEEPAFIITKRVADDDS